jgi:hypothetical protein
MKILKKPYANSNFRIVVMQCNAQQKPVQQNARNKSSLKEQIPPEDEQEPNKLKGR